jgi:hypothetical protein
LVSSPVIVVLAWAGADSAGVSDATRLPAAQEASGTVTISRKIVVTMLKFLLFFDTFLPVIDTLLMIIIH